MSPKFITSESTDDLVGVTFAFVCVDKGKSRSEIIDLLIKMKIPFIDVGMGLNRLNGTISGMLRSTYFSAESAQEQLSKRLVQMEDPSDDIYRNNIQISELNALNASLALIKFKQLRGFYSNDCEYNHLLFTVDSLSIVGE